MINHESIRHQMNRRAFLVGAGTISSILAGGCLSLTNDRREGVILTHVELGNATDEPQTFDVLVTHDEEIIYWTQHELDAGGEKVLAIDAPEEHDHVEVFVRVNDEWQKTDFVDEKYDGERVIAVVTYGMVEDKALRISRVIADRPPSRVTDHQEGSSVSDSPICVKIVVSSVEFSGTLVGITRQDMNRLPKRQ